MIEQEAEAIAKIMETRRVTQDEVKKDFQRKKKQSYLSVYLLAKEKWNANLMKRISWGWKCSKLRLKTEKEM